MLSISHVITTLLRLIDVCQHSFMHSFLKVPPQHFYQFEVWTLTGPFFFFRHSAVDLLLCLGSLSCWWPSFSQALAVRQMASHLTPEYFGIQRSSWTQWLQAIQVLWLQNKPTSSALHCRAWQLVWGVCADMLCLVFSKHAAVHYDQTSVLWSSPKSLFQKFRGLFRCNLQT